MLAMQGQHQLLRERREGRDKGDCRKERSGRGGLGGKKKRGWLGGKRKEVEEMRWEVGRKREEEVLYSVCV